MFIVLLLIAFVLVSSIATYALRLLVRRQLRDDIGKLSRLIVMLLALQFVLGMLANLFQAIPRTRPWVVFHELGPIAVHAPNALCLLILSAILLRIAVKQRRCVQAAIWGSVGTEVAFISGLIFVNFGQGGIFSFAMAVGFIVAMLAYTYVGFSALGRRQIEEGKRRSLTRS